mmetsp:Transcript_14276/g.31935  ORF Transcript_14276/g.31935 Transcript_14276/m.31935 type:complete len:221 (-) Transcript_14276:2053-2715(-)
MVELDQSAARLRIHESGVAGVAKDDRLVDVIVRPRRLGSEARELDVVLLQLHVIARHRDVSQEGAPHAPLHYFVVAFDVEPWGAHGGGAVLGHQRRVDNLTLILDLENRAASGASVDLPEDREAGNSLHPSLLLVDPHEHLMHDERLRLEQPALDVHIERVDEAAQGGERLHRRIHFRGDPTLVRELSNPVLNSLAALLQRAGRRDGPIPVKVREERVER